MVLAAVTVGAVPGRAGAVAGGAPELEQGYSTPVRVGDAAKGQAVDFDFSDGTHLRDLKAFANDGATDSHPAHQCGHLTMNIWNQVIVDVGGVAAGKKITQVTVGYGTAHSASVRRFGVAGLF